MSYPRKENRDQRIKKQFSKQEAKVKIAAYCAYQERCQKEVREKLYDYGLHSSEVEELVSVMIEEGFLNEERYARAFVRGKFYLKGWGRIKIRQELERKQIHPNCIRYGMQEIEEEDYRQSLLSQLEKKWHQLKDKDIFVKKGKTSQYLLYKGYEMDLIREAMEEFTKPL